MTSAAATSTSIGTPIRTCAGCGRRAPQVQLVRFHAERRPMGTQGPERDALVPGPGQGRGVYTCPRLACFERARSRRAFDRVLHRTVSVDPALARLYTDR